MLKFKPFSKSDIKACRRYFDFNGAMGLEYNLTHAFLWRGEYDLRTAVVQNTLIRAYFKDDGGLWAYCMPHGENPEAALEAITEDAHERGEALMLGYMSKSERAALEALCPDRFEFTQTEEVQDYIYLTRDLVELKGNKYHSKRNHISHFYRIYEDARVETIDPSNKRAVISIMDEWCEENEIFIREYGEYFAVKDAVDNFVELGLFGILIYIDSKPAAFAIGCPISDITFDVMFEKALSKYEGIYSVINNEFAQMLTSYKYINREEDMGIEGLKKSKMSYNPTIIYERYNAVEKTR